MPFDAAIELEEIKARLADRVEELAEQLFGPPKPETRKSANWLFPHTAGVSVCVRGSKKGQFFWHSGGAGGSMLDAIAHARSCSFTEAVRWAKSYLGITDTTPLPPVDSAILIERAKKKAAAQDKAESDERQRIAYARGTWNQSVPVAGTVAERYLIETRSIPAPASGWPPDAVRFHRQSNALVVAMTAPDGTVQAVQRVYLTADGLKVAATPDHPTKQTSGRMAGAAVRLPGFAVGPLMLAEGPETGLSVWASTGYAMHITIGPIPNYKPESNRPLMICRDDDKRFSPADRALTKAIETWRVSGIKVTVATPWPFRHQDKSDFNDTIRDGGPDAVRARIAAALEKPRAVAALTPRPEADRLLDAAVAKFFSAAMKHDKNSKETPPAHAIRLTVGGGKTHVARKHAIAMLADIREANRKLEKERSERKRKRIRTTENVADVIAEAESNFSLNPPKKDKRIVILAVPTRKLGDEQAERFEQDAAAGDEIKAAVEEAQAAGMTARVWRGREAPIQADEHMHKSEKRRTMCSDLDRIKDAEDAMESAQTTVCKKSKEGGGWLFCPHFDECHYQKQMKAKADLWIVAHALLFNEKPNAIKEPAALIVDESMWQAGLMFSNITTDSLLGIETTIRDTNQTVKQVTNRYGLSKHADFYWQVSWLDLAIVVYLTVWLVSMAQSTRHQRNDFATCGNVHPMLSTIIRMRRYQETLL